MSWDNILHTSSIKVHTTFEGTHYYGVAPDPVKDLRNEHRHIFHVRVQISVFHDDREVEFFVLKHDVENAIACLSTRTAGCYTLGACSCEMIGKKIYDSLKEKYKLLSRNVVISVSEDDNNEGILEVPASV